MLGEGGSEIIEEDPHGNRFGLAFQDIGVAHADVIVVEYEDLNIYRLLGGGDLPIQFGKKVRSIHEIREFPGLGVGEFFMIQHGFECRCAGCLGD